MAQNVTWDPQHYLSFDRHRLRPAIDLISQIQIDDPKRIVDLGCGPGHIAQILKERWANAEVCGIDNAPEMLEKAGGKYPEVKFELADLETWRDDQKVDVLFSNAALHWLEHHDQLLPHLLQQVNSSGVIAIQVPRNWEAPSHTSINDTVREGKWREQLAPVIRPAPSHAPDYYYKVLSPLSRSLEIWETEYTQVLEGENPVAEYVKGSWLQRFLQKLEEPERSEFESAYREKILKAYPKQADGKTLFPFRRLFILARV